MVKENYKESQERLVVNPLDLMFSTCSCGCCFNVKTVDEFETSTTDTVSLLQQFHLSALLHVFSQGQLIK